MRWFRSNIGLGSRLALFALALQIALTFNHVHVGSLTADAGKSVSVSVAGRSGGPGPENPSHKPNGLDDADCPICALILLASTAAPSIAPALPIPGTFIVIRALASGEAALTAFSYFSFQARAPPSL